MKNFTKKSKVHRLLLVDEIQKDITDLRVTFSFESKIKA